ncbi:cobQ/CobB/MinD/ParA nucleotide binding domain protein [Synechococcus sp. A18-40]|nr:cobQ/CobB/MinD/ParA nucleotide binding domain protein [Synechococcus sp. A18-40]
MFITVFGQKGGVAKTCSSIHIAACWSYQQKRVVLVDSDCNRSATAYGARELLPFPVVPIEAAAKATRLAEIVITDGQASSNEDEIKNLVEGADFILLPTTTQSRSIELTVEMSQMLRKYSVLFAALLVKVDARKEAAAEQAMELLQAFDIKVLESQIPLLSAFEQAETEGVTVDQAVDKRGRANPRRMTGWSAYCAACKEIEDLFEEHQKLRKNQSPIGWDFTRMEHRVAA